MRSCYVLPGTGPATIRPPGPSTDPHQRHGIAAAPSAPAATRPRAYITGRPHRSRGELLNSRSCPNEAERTNPVTGAELHPEMVLPEGLVVKRASLAASRRFEVSHDDVAYDHSGQYTAFGRFDYAGAA